MARMLFVSAYIDAHEHRELPKWAPYAGDGQDWMEHTPPGYPSECYRMAVALVLLINASNSCNLVEVFEKNCATDGHYREPTLDGLSEDIVLELLGTGSGWSDNHPDHDLILPHIEVWPYVSKSGRHYAGDDGYVLEHNDEKVVLYVEISGLKGC